jgi:hypothetical protein
MTLGVLHRSPRLAQKPTDHLGAVEHVGQEELDRDLLSELKVVRRDDDAHASLAQDSVDPIFAGELIADVDARRRDRGVHQEASRFRPVRSRARRGRKR